MLFGGPGDMFEKLSQTPPVDKAMSYSTSLGTWLVMTSLSGFAIIMLPRQFYVTIVENRNGGELRTATWLFPLYLVAINIFVLPIAFAGLCGRRRQDQQRPLRAVAAAAGGS
jgi:Na+/proline symporter